MKSEALMVFRAGVLYRLSDEWIGHFNEGLGEKDEKRYRYCILADPKGEYSIADVWIVDEDRYRHPCYSLCPVPLNRLSVTEVIEEEIDVPNLNFEYEFAQDILRQVQDIDGFYQAVNSELCDYIYQNQRDWAESFAESGSI